MIKAIARLSLNNNSERISDKCELHKLHMVAHVFKSSIWESEAGSCELGLTWATVYQLCPKLQQKRTM